MSICCNFFLSQKRYFKKTVSWWQSHGIDIWPSSNNTTLPIIWRRSPFVGDATISGWNFAHKCQFGYGIFLIVGLWAKINTIQVDCVSLSHNLSKIVYNLRKWYVSKIRLRKINFTKKSAHKLLFLNEKTKIRKFWMILGLKNSLLRSDFAPFRLTVIRCV